MGDILRISLWFWDFSLCNFRDLIYAKTACNNPKRKENLKSHHMTPLNEILLYILDLLFICSNLVCHWPINVLMLIFWPAVSWKEYVSNTSLNFHIMSLCPVKKKKRNWQATDAQQPILKGLYFSVFYCLLFKEIPWLLVLFFHAAYPLCAVKQTS